MGTISIVLKSETEPWVLVGVCFFTNQSHVCYVERLFYSAKKTEECVKDFLLRIGLDMRRRVVLARQTAKSLHTT